MAPLTLDDVMPLAEFQRRRPELFNSHRQYLDRYRRVRVGQVATLIFENRQTIWFQLQEVLRVARVADPSRINFELEFYNALLPRCGLLRASLIILPGAEFQTATPGVELVVAEHRIEAQRLSNDFASDGQANWLSFAVPPGQESMLELGPVCCEIKSVGESIQSPLMTTPLRRSLLADLRGAAHRAA